MQPRGRGGFRRVAAALLRAAVAQRNPARALPAAASRTSWWTSSRTPTACSTAGSSCWPAPHNAIFAVGDDDQSIYAFRGASAQNMFEFERDFATGRVIKLEQNYRSQGNILDAANALIHHNQRRLGKELWTDAGEGEPLRLYEARDRRRRSGVHRRGGAEACAAKACGCPRSRCCTAPTRSRACWSTRCSTPACPIACMAACASSSARKSSTRWPTCGSSPTQKTMARFCGWSTCRRAAWAAAAWSSCRKARARARRQLVAGGLRQPAGREGRLRA